MWSEYAVLGQGGMGRDRIGLAEMEFGGVWKWVTWVRDGREDDWLAAEGQIQPTL
jgi:hypothetical protein